MASLLCPFCLSFVVGYYEEINRKSDQLSFTWQLFKGLILIDHWVQVRIEEIWEEDTALLGYFSGFEAIASNFDLLVIVKTLNQA